jgi:two-component system chemotaxis sensor kinase CheA
MASAWSRRRSPPASSTSSEAARLSPKEQLQLIFEAGLSTAKAVTSISGRGVGMDVVRSNVERIGGVVEVDSKPGQGTRMTLRVPLTLTIIPALTVSIGSQHFAIPRVAIEEIVRASGESVSCREVGGAGLVTIRGRRVPQIVLADLLGLDSTAAGAGAHADRAQARRRRRLRARVDRVHDHEELVVKPAAPAVMATGLYAGTTLADDGSPILLFDPPGSPASAASSFEAQERSLRLLEDAAAALTWRRRRPRCCCSATARARAGRSASASSTGSRKCRAAPSRSPPGGSGCSSARTSCRSKASMRRPMRDTKVRLFRLSDGQTQLGLAFSEVIDLDAIADDIIPADVPGDGRRRDPGRGRAGRAGRCALAVRRHAAPRSSTGERRSAASTFRTPGCATCCARSWRPPATAWSLPRRRGGRPAIAWAGSRLSPAKRPADAVPQHRSDGAANENHIYRYDRAGLLVALREAATGKAQV